MKLNNNNNKSNKVPIKLHWLWFKQWLLWKLSGNSALFCKAKVNYAQAVKVWIMSNLKSWDDYKEK